MEIIELKWEKCLEIVKNYRQLQKIIIIFNHLCAFDFAIPCSKVKLLHVLQAGLANWQLSAFWSAGELSASIGRQTRAPSRRFSVHSCLVDGDLITYMLLEFDKFAWTFYFAARDTDLNPKNIKIRWKNYSSAPKNVWKFVGKSKKNTWISGKYPKNSISVISLYFQPIFGSFDINLGGFDIIFLTSQVWDSFLGRSKVFLAVLT